MSDLETAVLTMIVDQRDIRTVIRRKITTAHFTDPQSRAAFQFLLSWYSNPLYGDTPSWESFMRNFPQFEVNRVGEESLVALTDGLRQQKLYNDIASLLGNVGERVGGDPIDAFDFLRDQVVKLNSAHVIDETTKAVDAVDRILEQYRQMQSGATGGLKGLPWPWPALNRATLGIRKEDLIFMYGRPKSGKTWIMLAVIEHLRRLGFRVLLLSQELSKEQMEERVVAMATLVPWGPFQRGQLGEEGTLEFEDNLQAFAETDSITIGRVTSKGLAALVEISSLVDEYRPDIVFIDSYYMLTSRDWKDVSDLVSGTKDLCKNKGIPIVATTQANKSRGKTGHMQDDADDMAFADALFQFADLCLRLSADIEDKKARQRKVFTAAARNAEPALFTVNYILALDLSQKDEIPIDDDGEGGEMSETDDEEDVRE